MSVTTISSRDFNQDAGGAKKAAEKGPVIITDRGKPSHVLLSYEAYLKMSGGELNLAAALGDADSEYIEFEPPKMTGPVAKPVDFE